MYSTIFIMTIFFDAIILYLYFSVIMNTRKYTTFSPLLDISIFIGSQFLYTGMTYHLTSNISDRATAIRLVLNLIIFGLLTSLFNTKLWLKLFTIISYLAIISLSEILAMFIVKKLVHFTLNQEYVPDIIFDILPAIMDLILIVFISLIASITIKGKKINSKDHILLLTITPLLSLIITLFPAVFELSYIAPLTYILLIYFLVFINATNYLLMKNVIASEQLLSKSLEQERQLNYQQHKYQQLSDAYRNIRSFIHDIKKHMSYIEQCCIQDKHKNIIPYIQEVNNDLESRYCMVNTGNLAIDTFISNLLIQSEKSNIHVDLNLKVDANKIHIKDYDLAIILGNLIDNALNASQYNETIIVSIYTLDDNFVIHTKNPIHAIDRIYLNEKSNKLTHGYGLENINSTLSKYKGFSVTENTKEFFSITIIIPI